MKTITFWQVEKDDNTLVIDQSYLNALTATAKQNTGVEYAAMTDDDIVALYGDKAVRRTVTLKPNSYRLRLDMQCLASRKDADKGLGVDETLMPAARVAATVEKWDMVDVDGKPAEVSVEGFCGLPMPVADYIDSQIIAYLNPDVIRDPDFLSLFASKSRPSETPKVA